MDSGGPAATGARARGRPATGHEPRTRVGVDRPGRGQRGRSAARIAGARRRRTGVAAGSGDPAVAGGTGNRQRRDAGVDRGPQARAGDRRSHRAADCRRTRRSRRDARRGGAGRRRRGRGTRRRSRPGTGDRRSGSGRPGPAAARRARTHAPARPGTRGTAAVRRHRPRGLSAHRARTVQAHRRPRGRRRPFVVVGAAPDRRRRRDRRHRHPAPNKHARHRRTRAGRRAAAPRPAGTGPGDTGRTRAGAVRPLRVGHVRPGVGGRRRAAGAHGMARCRPVAPARERGDDHRPAHVPLRLARGERPLAARRRLQPRIGGRGFPAAARARGGDQGQRAPRRRSGHPPPDQRRTRSDRGCHHGAPRTDRPAAGCSGGDRRGHPAATRTGGPRGREPAPGPGGTRCRTGVPGPGPVAASRPSRQRGLRGARACGPGAQPSDRPADPRHGRRAGGPFPPLDRAPGAGLLPVRPARRGRPPGGQVAAALQDRVRRPRLSAEVLGRPRGVGFRHGGLGRGPGLLRTGELGADPVHRRARPRPDRRGDRGRRPRLRLRRRDRPYSLRRGRIRLRPAGPDRARAARRHRGSLFPRRARPGLRDRVAGRLPPVCPGGRVGAAGGPAGRLAVVGRRTPQRDLLRTAGHQACPGSRADARARPAGRPGVRRPGRRRGRLRGVPRRTPRLRSRCRPGDPGGAGHPGRGEHEHLLARLPGLHLPLP
ncbi:predicted protein [Streptomyces sp. AA4]|nr:predicted protein [Streptomyces sp. AA4]